MEGEHVVDGSIADPIPVEEAYRRGARRIVVVRSRAATFVKKPGLANLASSALFWRTPALRRAVATLPERYATAVDFINRPPADCEIIHVTPDAPLATGRTTQDAKTLAHDYELGRRAGARAVERWPDLIRARTTER